MPRYEFVEGTSRKFWEITLSGKSFTTTYGRIGSAGQSTTKKFGTEAEASRQYEKLMVEKVAKGYQPAAAAKPAALPKEAERAARPIKTKALKKGATAPAHFGGDARLAAGEAWPHCKNCKRPMPLFVEMDLAKVKLPKKVSGLLQLFYCNATDPLCEVDCESWGLNDNAMLLRVLPATRKTAVVARPEVPSPVAARSIDFGADKTDLPNWEDAADLFGMKEAIDDDEDDASSRTLDGDKLLGWPNWVQGAEWPTCKQCQKPMQHLLQLESNAGLDHQWGDLGRAHVFLCMNHPARVGFVWQCG